MPKKQKDDLKKEGNLKQCQKERDEYLVGWQRQKADFANYQKDVGEQMQKIKSIANEDLIFKLLAILDSFDLSISAFQKIDLSEKGRNMLKGVELISNQMEWVLRGEGLEMIEATKGKEFDPEIHEAIENDNLEGEGKLIISEEILRGYKLNGKIIRPSKVKTKS